MVFFFAGRFFRAIFFLATFFLGLALGFPLAAHSTHILPLGLDARTAQSALVLTFLGTLEHVVLVWYVLLPFRWKNGIIKPPGWGERSVRLQ